MRHSIAAVALLFAGCGASQPPIQSTESTPPPTRPEDSELIARVAALEERLDALEARNREPPPVVERPVTVPKSGDPELVGEHHYRVPRAFFDALVNSGEREARLVPVTKNNQVVGLKLFGIRAETRLAQLGFQNGDQLQTLNDISLTSPDEALKAYAGVRNATTLRVRLVRQGQSIELRYDISE